MVAAGWCAGDVHLFSKSARPVPHGQKQIGGIAVGDDRLAYACVGRDVATYGGAGLISRLGRKELHPMRAPITKPLLVTSWKDKAKLLGLLLQVSRCTGMA